MAKTKEQKKEMLADYKQRLTDAFGIIVISQEGLKPFEIDDIKRRLRQTSSSFQVVKNTLFNIALKDADLPQLDVFSGGSNSVIYSSEDIAGTAKIISEFAKEYKERVFIKAGILDGQALSVTETLSLSSMPTKLQSISMIAGLLQQNMVGVVNVLEDSIRSVAIILDKAFTEDSKS
jgi:large subunit ribosomal protein L10